MTIAVTEADHSLGYALRKHVGLSMDNRARHKLHGLRVPDGEKIIVLAFCEIDPDTKVELQMMAQRFSSELEFIALPRR